MPAGRHLGTRPSFRIERLKLFPIVEGEAIDIVDERFRRHVLSQDEPVIGKLEVVVGKRLRGAVRA